MYLWIDFFLVIFWISIIGFLINYNNFLFVFLYSELTWVILYSISIVLGLNLEDLNLFSNSFFVLGLAGIEYSIGFLMIILFKNFNVSINFIDNTNLINYNKL